MLIDCTELISNIGCLPYLTVALSSSTEREKIEQRDKAEEKRLNAELIKIKLISPKVSELKTLDDFLREVEGN